MAKRKQSIAGSIFLSLFFLPFAGVGAVMLYLTISTIVIFGLQQSWPKAPATIESCNLIKNRSNKSTTFKAEATYTYTFKGKQYTSSQVSQYSSADNLGSFHEDLYRRLNQHKANNTPYHCFVNPNNPEDAVLNRDLRLGKVGLFALFGLVFGGVGFGLLGFNIISIFKLRHRNHLQELLPDQPWQTNPAWNDGVIKSSNKTTMFAALGIALFWNAISSPVLFVIPKELAKKNYAALIALIFPLVGLGIIIFAIREIIRWRKFGDSTFAMKTFPGVIGGTLEGTIDTTVNIIPEDGFHLKLSNIKLVTTGSGKNRSTSEHVLWEDEKIIKKELLDYDTTRSSIPVYFVIPYHQRSTDIDDGRIFWRLEVNAKVPGVDYKASFKVPVFKTEASSPDFVAPDPELTANEIKVDPASAIQAAGIRIGTSWHGHPQYTFPMARNLGPTLFLTFFFIVWTAISVFLLYSKAPLIFKIVWPGSDLIIFVILLFGWFEKRTIEISDDALTVKGGLFGLGSPKTIELAEIKSFNIRSGMQSGNKIYYRVVAKTHSGKEIVMGKGLCGKPLANQFITELEKHL